MKTTVITQATRQIARNTKATLEKSGKECKILDNGKGSANRWQVVVMGREILSIGRKPSTPCNRIGKRETAHSASQWLSNRNTRRIEVFVKRSVTA